MTKTKTAPPAVDLSNAPRLPERPENVEAQLNEARAELKTARERHDELRARYRNVLAEQPASAIAKYEERMEDAAREVRRLEARVEALEEKLEDLRARQAEAIQWFEARREALVARRDYAVSVLYPRLDALWGEAVPILEELKAIADEFRRFDDKKYLAKIGEVESPRSAESIARPRNPAIHENTVLPPVREDGPHWGGVSWRTR